MKKRISPIRASRMGYAGQISVKLANISGSRLSDSTELAEVRKKPFLRKEEVLVGFDAAGHS
jgi:hypothetical protein